MGVKAADALPPCRGCDDSLVKRWGGSLYCPSCYEARYHPGRVRPPRPDPPLCKGCGEPLIERAGKRLYHPHCAYLRYSAAYEKQAALEGGERTALYKQKMARNGLAKRTRRRARVKLAFRYLLPGQPHADPRTEPWSLGWLERLYDLDPTLVSGNKPPRHNPAHSLASTTGPELRKLMGHLVSPSNPLSEPELKTKQDRKRMAKEGREGVPSKLLGVGGGPTAIGMGT